MKYTYIFFGLFLFALPSMSWGADRTLDCKYDYTVYLAKAANNAQQDDGHEGLTLSINFDSKLLVQDNIDHIPFTIEGDILSYKLVGTHKKYPAQYYYQLNAVSRRLKLEERGRVANHEDWWKVDSDGYASIHNYFYDCVWINYK